MDTFHSWSYWPIVLHKLSVSKFTQGSLRKKAKLIVMIKRHYIESKTASTAGYYQINQNSISEIQIINNNINI